MNFAHETRQTSSQVKTIMYCHVNRPLRSEVFTCVPAWTGAGPDREWLPLAADQALGQPGERGREKDRERKIERNGYIYTYIYIYVYIYIYIYVCVCVYIYRERKREAPPCRRQRLREGKEGEGRETSAPLGLTGSFRQKMTDEYQETGDLISELLETCQAELSVFFRGLGGKGGVRKRCHVSNKLEQCWRSCLLAPSITNLHSRPNSMIFDLGFNLVRKPNSIL